MLHRDLNSEEATPLPQRRITPDELERAIATLDARRKEQERQQEEEARYLAGTLSLEQAVGTLNLDYTPEEIWAEVRHEREQTPDAVPETAIAEEAEVEPESVAIPPQFQYYTLEAENGQNNYPSYTEQSPFEKDLEKHLFPALAVAGVMMEGLIIGFASCGQTGHMPPVVTPPYVQSNTPHYLPYNSSTSYVNPETRITSTLDDVFYSKLRQSQGPTPRYHITLVTLFPPYNIRPDEALYPIRAIPGGYSVYLQSGPSAAFRFGESAVAFRETDDAEYSYSSPSAFPYHYMPTGPGIITTRYAGQNYVRCWVRRTDVPTLKLNRPVTLYRTREEADTVSATDLVPVTIPYSRYPMQPSLDLLRIESYLRHGPHISTSQYGTPPQLPIKLDGHAWEDYTTLRLPQYQPPAWAKIPGVFSDFANVAPQLFSRYEEFDASSHVKSLGQISAYHPFHCDLVILRELVAATHSGTEETVTPEPVTYQTFPLSQILVDVRPNLHRPYTFVKINESFYLRGWVETKMTEQQMRGHTITVHTDSADPELGYAPTQIQLRLDRCQIDPQITRSYNAERTIPVSDVHLDKHAWETWKS